MNVTGTQIMHLVGDCQRRKEEHMARTRADGLPAKGGECGG